MLTICPHCRRMAHIGTATGGDEDDKRCIDCWFEPEQECWIAVARCVLRNGQTGDIVRKDFSQDHFWPHDDDPDAWKTKPVPIADNEVAYRFPVRLL